MNYENILKHALTDVSDEAKEMRKIISRIMKAELDWVKENGHQNPCPRCQELGITQSK